MLSLADNETVTQVGPRTPMGDYLRSFWMPFLLTEELPAPDCPPVRVELLNEQLVAFRDTSGRVGLVQHRCPHRRAGLFYGRNEENGLRCVYHGWKFDVEGNCVDMPAEPEWSNFRNKVRITAYPCRETGGVIWTYMGPPDRTPSIPDLGWLSVPPDHRYITKRIERANWVQGMEGGLDPAHSNYLHSTMDRHWQTPQWRETMKNSPRLRDRYHAFDKSPRFFVHETDYGLLIGAQRNAEPDTFYWRVTHWAAPFYNLIGQQPATSAGPVTRAGSLAWIPLNDTTTFVFKVDWRDDRPLSEDDVRAAENFSGPTLPGSFLPAGNAENDYLIDRGLQQTTTFTGIGATQWQDLAVQETMGPIVDRTEEHLGISDTAIIRMRQLLLRGARDLREGAEPYGASHPDVYNIRAAEAVLPRSDGFDPHLLRSFSEVGAGNGATGA
ncbi:MAG: Rieske 2Fe-2S domain-containing protein [Chloroflexota bacterium]|nr:Rieske 2Fe-2S domain-containing protein [Chloroflexota bacterium]MDE2885203.1 Rieske 2Fe-2S domain-containing protein [Chloroflexota bacterium]